MDLKSVLTFYVHTIKIQLQKLQKKKKKKSLGLISSKVSRNYPQVYHMLVSGWG